MQWGPTQSQKTVEGAVWPPEGGSALEQPFCTVYARLTFLTVLSRSLLLRESSTQYFHCFIHGWSPGCLFVFQLSEIVLKQMSNTFKLWDMGEPRLFLGMEFSSIRGQGLVMLSQGDYVSKLVAKFGVAETLRPTTPIKSDFYKQLELCQSEPFIQDFPYRELVGALIFVMVCTRPDTAFAVTCLTQYFRPHVHCTGRLPCVVWPIWNRPIRLDLCLIAAHLLN